MAVPFKGYQDLHTAILKGPLTPGSTFQRVSTLTSYFEILMTAMFQPLITLLNTGITCNSQDRNKKVDDPQTDRIQDACLLIFNASQDLPASVKTRPGTPS